MKISFCSDNRLAYIDGELASISEGGGCVEGRILRWEMGGRFGHFEKIQGGIRTEGQI